MKVAPDRYAYVRPMHTARRLEVCARPDGGQGEGEGEGEGEGGRGQGAGGMFSARIVFRSKVVAGKGVPMREEAIRCASMVSTLSGAFRSPARSGEFRLRTTGDLVTSVNTRRFFLTLGIVTLGQPPRPLPSRGVPCRERTPNENACVGTASALRINSEHREAVDLSDSVHSRSRLLAISPSRPFRATLDSHILRDVSTMRGAG